MSQAQPNFSLMMEVADMCEETRRPIKVGVYVDAFNLYYGARDWCGKDQPGWRWLDIIGLVESVLAEYHNWGGAKVAKLVYCTALRDKDTDPSSRMDQETYIGALKVDPRVMVEYGQYVEKHSVGALRDGSNNRSTKLLDARHLEVPSWLSHRVKVQPDGLEAILVNVQTFEEKASDVNIASHLLLDVVEKRIDRAVVISNDGDLRFALASARQKVPIGLINPTKRHTVRLLMDESSGDNNGSWWRRLSEADFRNYQLRNNVEDYTKPLGW